MDLSFLFRVFHEPDVALTDFVVCIETCVFAVILLRLQPQTPLHRFAGLLFAFLSASSFCGALYHGFFPLRTGTNGGWFVWIATMLTLGGAATMAWSVNALLLGKSLRWVIPLSLLLFVVYLLCVLFINHEFVMSIIFSLPPLVVMLCIFCEKALRRNSRVSVYGAVSILLMFVASALQQLRIGLHPAYFNHNALYHLIQGIALWMLFSALMRIKVAGPRGIEPRLAD